jgi:hypothetical protein
MHFDEYEKKYQTWYAEFAGVVRDILEKAINGAEGAPRPLSREGSKPPEAEIGSSGVIGVIFY